MGRKRKVLKSNYSSLGKISFKDILCSKCGVKKVKVSAEAIGGKCWLCCQKMVGPPIQLIKANEQINHKQRKQRGWQFMKVYVDLEGNVYHKGVEQPKLKGTLSSTPKKEYKKKTIREKIDAEEKQRKKLITRYKKAQEEKDKKSGKVKLKRGRKPKNFIE